MSVLSTYQENNSQSHSEPAVSGRVRPVTTPASVKHYKAGETIYFEGEESPYCFQLIDGLVKEYNTLEDGGCQIIEFYGDGEIFGLTEIREQLHTAEAITDCSVKCFQRDRFISSIACSTDMTEQFVLNLLARLHRSQDRLVMLGRMTALQKVSTFLFRLSGMNDDSEEIHLKMTRQDIADYLGLTIETVSRAFGELKKLGWIKLISSRKLVLTDLEAIRSSVSEATSLR